MGCYSYINADGLCNEMFMIKWIDDSELWDAIAISIIMRGVMIQNW